MKSMSNKIASQRKTHTPWRFLYLRETKSWWCGEEEEEEEGEGEEEEEGEKISMLTHATARGMGKNRSEKQNEIENRGWNGSL